MISPGIDRDRITPEWLTKLTEPIEALYTALQHDLIVNIARQFNVFGRKANIPTSYAWRGYMLGQLGGLTKENYDTIARYSGDISEATRLAVQTSVEASVGVVDRAFMEEVLDPDYAPEITETTERVTGYYVNQALEKQNLVNTVMLNSTRRYYEQAVGATSDALDQSLDAAQQALNAAAGGVIHGTTDFYSALRDCVRDMADHGLTGFYDKAGREWSAQAYVTMDMRTTAANAAREAAMERNREYGNELIAVSSHPGARPLCEPYQGGVYSTDGSTGETTDVHGASISYYPLELTSYGEAAGLFGINCGHYPSPFIPGLSVVRKLDISHEENERLYKESQHQRYMERRVRAAKIEADALKAAGDAEGAKAARAKARERNAELKAWCKERERAYYPERVRVTRGEKTESPKEPATSSATNSASIDVIRTEEKGLSLPSVQNTSGTTESSEGAPIQSVREAKAFKGLTDYMWERYNIRVDEGIKDLRLGDVKKALQGVESVIKQFPVVGEQIHEIKLGTRGIMSALPNSIHFNPEYFGKKAMTSEQLRDFFNLHAGVDFIRGASLESVGQHEAGHILEAVPIHLSPDMDEAAKIHAWQNGTEAEKIVMSAYARLKNTPSYEHRNLTSMVTEMIPMIEANHDPSEILANAVADVMTNEEDAAPISKEIMRIIRERLGTK